MQDVLLNKSHNFPPEKVSTPSKNTFSLLLSHFFVEIMPQNLVNRWKYNKFATQSLQNRLLSFTSSLRGQIKTLQVKEKPTSKVFTPQQSFLLATWIYATYSCCITFQDTFSLRKAAHNSLTTTLDRLCNRSPPTSLLPQWKDSTYCFSFAACWQQMHSHNSFLSFQRPKNLSFSAYNLPKVMCFSPMKAMATYWNRKWHCP